MATPPPSWQSPQQQQQALLLRFAPGASSNSARSTSAKQKRKTQGTQMQPTPSPMDLKPRIVTTTRPSLVSSRQLAGASRYEQTVFLCQLTTQSRAVESTMRKTRERLEKITRERKLRPAEIRELYQLDLRVRMALFAQQLVQEQLVSLPAADAPDQVPILAAPRDEILERFNTPCEDALNRSGPVLRQEEQQSSVRTAESPLASSSAEEMIFGSSDEDKTAAAAAGMFTSLDQEPSPFGYDYDFFFGEEERTPLSAAATAAADADWLAPVQDDDDDDALLDRFLDGTLA
jgi:hypothetical protein